MPTDTALELGIIIWGSAQRQITWWDMISISKNQIQTVTLVTKITKACSCVCLCIIAKMIKVDSRLRAEILTQPLSLHLKALGKM